MFFTEKKFYHLVLEIYRCGLLLPTSFYKEVIAFAEVFIGFLCYNPPNLIPNERFELTIVAFDTLSSIFTTTPTVNPEGFRTLIQKVVAFYTANSQRLLNLNDPTETREFLLVTIRAVSKMINPEQPKDNKDVIAAEMPGFISTVLTIWMTHMMLKEDIWQQLQAVFEPALEYKPVVDQLRMKLIHLTVVITEICYPLSEMKKADLQQRQQQQQQQEDGTGAAPKKDKDWIVYDTWKDVARRISTKDPSLSHIAFNKDNAYWIWNALFYIFHNVHKISTPQVYVNCLTVISELLNIFLLAEDNVALDPHGVQSELPRMPLLSVFGPVFFQAANDTARAGGAAIAFGALSRLFCRRFPTHPLPVLSHYYFALTKGFYSNNHAILWPIISSSYAIFAQGLEGVNVLIPFYINAINELLFSQSTVPPPSTGRTKCIMILSSLVSYPQHYKEMRVPMPGSNDVLTAPKCRELLQATLAKCANAQVFPPEVRCGAVWSLATMFAEEAKSNNGEHCLELAAIILPLCVSETEDVTVCACNAIGFLGSEFPNTPATVNIIETLCEFIRGLKGAVCRIHHLFFALTRILVGGQRPIVENLQPAVIEKVFVAINVGMHVDNVVALPSVPKDPAPSGKKKDKHGDLPPQQPPPPAQTANFGREAATILLTYLLHYHRYPMENGISISCSTTTEGDDAPQRNAVYWVFNNTSIVSVCELPSPDGGTRCRLILRNAAGKWSWDFHAADTLADLGLPDEFKQFDRRTDFANVSTAQRSTHLTTTVPEKVPGTAALSSRNKISDLCDSIEENYPELSKWVPSLLDSEKILRSELSQGEVSRIEEMAKMLEALDAEEKRGRGASANSWAPLSPPQPCPKRLFDPRILLQHLGFIAPDSPLPQVLLRINISDRFLRALQALDSLQPREHHKFGLIYVKELQETQYEILSNTQESGTSDLYDAFAHGLGWDVNLQRHQGYLGGLDRTSCGLTSLYYANTLTEIIYHETTAIPAGKDVQQINKKRHVGNDFVHFIWSEHVRDYAPGTIVSQLNDERIVFYPLPNGLVGVQVFKKPSLQCSGPLQNAMAVNADLLPLLARETALDASRYITAKMNNLPYFFRIGIDRRRVISEIAERYRESTSYLQEIVSVGLPSTAPQQQQQPLPPQSPQSPILQPQGLASPILPSSPPPPSQIPPPQRLPPQQSVSSAPPQKLPVLPPQPQNVPPQPPRPYPGQPALGKLPPQGLPSPHPRMDARWNALGEDVREEGVVSVLDEFCFMLDLYSVHWFAVLCTVHRIFNLIYYPLFVVKHHHTIICSLKNYSSELLMKLL